MISSEYASYLDDLERIAREASVAEEQLRKDVARKAEQLRIARVFAFRRFNLLRAIGKAVATAKDEEEAQASGRRVFFREVGWNGATQHQRDTAERFGPVILAIWKAARTDGEAGEKFSVPVELATFEQWFEEDRGTAFLNLMEREIVELPLVEV